MDAVSPVPALVEHPITVLLVDDQAIIGETVRRMLAAETDVRFHFCRDPLKALEMATSLSPTVILQDLVMPDVDGLTLVRLFRADPRTRDIPLIVLSTKEEPEVKAQAFAYGANDYLVKLPDRVELVARVRYHSKGYIALLERNQAFKALVESQRQLEVRNRFIRDTFGRYLSDEIVENLLERPGGLALGGEKRRVTIMMADLRGFTSLSERLPPEKVVRMINHFLEEMTEVIVKHRGTIDEFIGDAILAIFGAPELREDDADRAVACALEMQLAMAKVNERNLQEGLPTVEMGIGVNTGEVVVGNIGSKKRAKYGVVGSTVNLTSRVESYTLGGQILVAPSTYEAVASPLVVQARMEVEPKGVKRPITIHDVVGIEGPFNLHLPRRDEGLVGLAEPIGVRFKPLEGKNAGGESLPALLVKLSGRAAELRAAVAPAVLTNLKLQLLAPDGSVQFEDLYAKVQRDLGGGAFAIRFTAVPDDAEKHLAARLAAARGSVPVAAS